MDRRKIQLIITSLQQAFQSRNIQIDRFVVFGSQAEGRSHADSDLDIIIISDEFEGKTIFERAQITGPVHWDIVHFFKIPLDLIAMTNDEFDTGPSLIAQYAKQGHILFAGR
ncbi:MAG: nucleotidyltransferase domain-containing protein [Candidatus Atribacteria bacterium]|nr:nucleotidyltransferase domain-containing protein [Candidatus Atribacteria bacterium]